MASLTIYFCNRHVDAMRKINMGGQAPHTLPGDLPTAVAQSPKLFDLFALGVSSHVTGQTQCRRRPARDRTFLRPLMTARADKLKVYMSLVGELDRLLDAGLNSRNPKS
jgi:hypothetical protein